MGACECNFYASARGASSRGLNRDPERIPRLGIEGLAELLRIRTKPLPACRVVYLRDVGDELPAGVVCQ
jgi:hypothetical protein